MLRTLTRRSAAVAAFAAAVWTLAWSPAPRASAADQASDRDARQRVVSIGVVRDEAPVRDLKMTEVTVKEDGANREILSVAPALPPSHLALLLDDSEASQPLVAELRNGAGGFLQAFEGNTPAPNVAYWTFGDRPTRVTEYSTNIALAGAAATKLFTKTGAGAYFLEAILEVCKDLKKMEAKRPVIVAYLTEDGPEFSNQSHDRIEAALRESGASLWALVLQSRVNENESREGRERSIVLGDVIRASGGYSKTILSRQSIGPGFQALSAMITSRYDVTYGRPDKMIPPKKLEVAVSRGGVRIQSPRWPQP
jgi:hypothetical protein